MSAAPIPDALNRAVTLSRLEELERELSLLGQQVAIMESAISVMRSIYDGASRRLRLLHEALTDGPRA